MGHFIGLDHTCLLNGVYPLDDSHKPIIPIDNLGQPVPSCDDVSYPEPDMNLKPTMYPSANPGDLEKRTLSDDDRAGLCAIYPVGTTPVSCGIERGLFDRRDRGGRRDARPSARPAWLVVALADRGVGGRRRLVRLVARPPAPATSRLTAADSDQDRASSSRRSRTEGSPMVPAAGTCT